MDELMKGVKIGKLLGKDEKNEFDETVRKVALSAADFLGRQMN